MNREERRPLRGDAKARAEYSVKAMQEHLRFLVDPTLAARGEWDERSEKAMRIFQEENGLSVTGRGDGASFALLEEMGTAARKGRGERAMLRTDVFFPKNGKLGAGDAGEGVYLLQLMLMAAFFGEDLIENMAITGVMDEATIRAVERAREIMGVGEGGEVDAQIWDEMAKLIQNSECGIRN